MPRKIVRFNPTAPGVEDQLRQANREVQELARDPEPFIKESGFVTHTYRQRSVGPFRRK